DFHVTGVQTCALPICGHRGRPADRSKKGLIELAYRVAEAVGIPVWCQDEAGPYQAIPQPGQSWRPEGRPVCQPHEYIRGGTAKRSEERRVGKEVGSGS